VDGWSLYPLHFLKYFLSTSVFVSPSFSLFFLIAKKRASERARVARPIAVRIDRARAVVEEEEEGGKATSEEEEGVDVKRVSRLSSAVSNPFEPPFRNLAARGLGGRRIFGRQHVARLPRRGPDLPGRFDVPVGISSRRRQGF